jgi:hypothetical protein
MNNLVNNSANLDFERTMLYTRKRPDELNYHNNNADNVKKPLPIHFKSDKNDTFQIDPKFTINPITGQNSVAKLDNYNYPMNSYQNKKECRTEMESRISGYHNLPQTQAMPVINNANSNSQVFSHIPLNTRLSNSNDIYSHIN